MRAWKESVGPVGEEEVGFMRGFAIAIGGPDETLAIGSEHRESVEIWSEGDALEPSAVFVDQVEIEVAAVLGVGEV